MKKIILHKLKEKNSSLLIVAILIVSFQSCVKDNFQFSKIAEVKWNPNVAAPLVYASLSIKDMLNKTSGSQNLIVEAADKSLTIVYKGSLFSLDGSSLVNLHNQTFPLSLPVGAALPTPFTIGNTVTVTYTQTIPFGTGGPLIDSIKLKSGTFFFSFTSDLHNDGSILITIPSAQKNGIVFSETLPLNYTGTVPVSASANYDLTDYTFDMTAGGTTSNQFIVNYVVTLNGSATAPSNTDQIAVSLSMNDLQFLKIFGDMGQMPLSLSADTIELSIFTNSAGAGSFTLVDPRIKVTFSNSYGLPIDARISTFQGYNPGVNFYPITGFPDPLPIPSPTLSQVGQILVDSFKLDKSNSNMAILINNTPKQIILKVDATTNIANPTQNNFILDTSRFTIDVEVELPLYGTAKNFSLVDSIPFTFNETMPDQVEWGLIRTFNSNGFPIDLDLQVYFVDSLYTRLDSLVVPNQILVKSGVVNAVTGRVTSPTETIYDAVLDKARWLKLKKAKNLVIVASVSTTNFGNTDVKIYSDYKLDFKLGVQVQLRIQAKQ